MGLLWRRRRQAGLQQQQGHSRGLLPAIDSAEAIRSVHKEVLESHPEVVFAALTGQPLPAAGRKRLLLGILVRIVLLREQGIALDLDQIAAMGIVPTDNLIDAAAMALVARCWALRGAQLPVIRSADGNSEPLGTSEERDHLIALPEGQRRPGDQPLTAPQLVNLASRFRPA